MISVRDEYLAAMGEVTVNFQSLEATTRMFAAGLISPDQKLGLIVTSQQSFQRLCQLLEALFRYRSTSEERLRQLTELLKRASTAEERRNSIVHSSWLTSEPNSEGRETVARVKISTKQKHGLKVDFEAIQPHDLRALANELRGLVVAMTQLYSATREAGEASLPLELSLDAEN